MLEEVVRAVPGRNLAVSDLLLAVSCCLCCQGGIFLMDEDGESLCLTVSASCRRRSVTCDRVRWAFATAATRPPAGGTVLAMLDGRHEISYPA